MNEELEKQLRKDLLVAIAQYTKDIQEIMRMNPPEMRPSMSDYIICMLQDNYEITRNEGGDKLIDSFA